MMRQLVFFMVLVFITPSSFAASISKIKGSGALIDLQGDAVNPGDTYFAMDGGKKKALIRIVKVKGDKAIAKIVKGNATPGMSLERGPSGGSVASGGGSSSGGKHKRKSSSDSNEDSRSYWGVLLGYSSDVMSVNVNNYYPPGNSLGTVAMAGSGFSGKALFDYDLFGQFWFRGTSGLEQFSASGSSKCGVANAQGCEVKITYLTLDFIGRFLFATGSFRPWLGAGVGLLFPASKDSTALASDSIGTTNVLMVQGGFDWFISPNMYIPVTLEYGLLPKSDEVEAHWIAFRTGLAIPF